MKETQNLTPMMKQYYENKDEHPDHILFFRMGDFYEMFAEDAVIASKILGIALTSRDKKKDDGVPMCGIPYHSYKSYLLKLLNAGKSVAICEQLEDPSQAKGIVKRGVVEVVTPGTILDDEGLSAESNNYFAAVHKEEDKLYVAVTDISTGEIFLEQTRAENIDEVLGRWKAKEIFADGTVKSDIFSIDVVDWKFSSQAASIKVMDHYNVGSPKAVGVDRHGFLCAIYLSLNYISRLMIDIRLKRPKIFTPDSILYVDSIAARTLELTENSIDGSDKNTIFSVLNKCSTSMGARELKRWLHYPLQNIEQILRRQEIVEFLVRSYDYRSSLDEMFENVYDLERIITRLLSGKCSPRDLVWLKNSVSSFPLIKALLMKADNPHLSEIGNDFDSLGEVYQLIDKAIVDEPPINIKDGGIIKSGYHEEVDEYRTISKDSKQILAQIEAQEKRETGISNLKIKYNKVFGYYIEISKANLDKVPIYYERKQTLVNAERFIIPELKELERKIVHASDRLATLEHELFTDVRKSLTFHTESLRRAAGVISELDILCSFAKTAEENGYIRPEIGDYDELTVRDGRHPVVEQAVKGDYVPNDIMLDGESHMLSVITGPNMAGKSTYLRTCAVIALMAHTGSFVPASSAKIGLIDRIFTRVGASDNLAAGESTFMVEMVETANILNNATPKSLIILDEIGRGTSTFDGVSIAWSVAEYILEKIKAKTLFATHYHELTDIALSSHGANNLTVEVQEWKDDIIFMRKVKPGSADRSYGIHVGKLAGLPEKVISRGYEILERLEKNEFNIDGTPNLSSKKHTESVAIQPMLVFNDHPVLDQLKDLDINSMTPLDALNALNELKKRAED